ncbi:MAG: LPP20 family lipoprotein [Alphaproteobacteria bacterium]|nr:LPP20 family lipoprotein [Alphaproteobacteria bacterium]
MNKSIILGSILSALLIAGCATKKETTEITQCNFPDAPNTAAPLWVCGGAVEGVAIAAVGAAQKSHANVNFMLQQATANGRLALAQEIQSDIQAKVKSFTETTGNYDSETINQVNSLIYQQITNQKLQGTKAFNRITSPNGTLYVLVGFDKNIYENLLKDSLHTSYQDNQAQWQRTLSEKAFEQLEESIAHSHE